MNLKEQHFNTLNIEKSNYFHKTIKQNFKAAYYHYKDQNDLIEQSPVTSTPIKQTLLTKYSNKGVTSLENVGSFKQNTEKNRSEKNCWKEK